MNSTKASNSLRELEQVLKRKIREKQYSRDLTSQKDSVDRLKKEFASPARKIPDLEDEVDETDYCLKPIAKQSGRRGIKEEKSPSSRRSHITTQKVTQCETDRVVRVHLKPASPLREKSVRRTPQPQRRLMDKLPQMLEEVISSSEATLAALNSANGQVVNKHKTNCMKLLPVITEFLEARKEEKKHNGETTPIFSQIKPSENHVENENARLKKEIRELQEQLERYSQWQDSSKFNEIKMQMRQMEKELAGLRAKPDTVTVNFKASEKYRTQYEQMVDKLRKLNAYFHRMNHSPRSDFEGDIMGQFEKVFVGLINRNEQLVADSKRGEEARKKMPELIAQNSELKEAIERFEKQIQQDNEIIQQLQVAIQKQKTQQSIHLEQRDKELSLYKSQITVLHESLTELQLKSSECLKTNASKFDEQQLSKVKSHAAHLESMNLKSQATIKQLQKQLEKQKETQLKIQSAKEQSVKEDSQGPLSSGCCSEQRNPTLGYYSTKQLDEREDKEVLDRMETFEANHKRILDVFQRYYKEAEAKHRQTNESITQLTLKEQAWEEKQAALKKIIEQDYKAYEEKQKAIQLRLAHQDGLLSAEKEKVITLNYQNGKAKQKIKSLLQDIAQLEETVHQQQVEIDEQQIALQQRKQEQSKFCPEQDSYAVDTIRKEVEYLKETCQQLAQQLQEKEAQVEYLSEENHSLKGHREVRPQQAQPSILQPGVQESRASMRASYKRVELRLQSKKELNTADLRELEQELQEMQTRTAEIQTRAVEMETKAAEQQKQNEQLREQLKQISEQIRINEKCGQDEKELTEMKNYQYSFLLKKILRFLIDPSLVQSENSFEKLLEIGAEQVFDAKRQILDMESARKKKKKESRGSENAATDSLLSSEEIIIPAMDFITYSKNKVIRKPMNVTRNVDWESKETSNFSKKKVIENGV